MKLLSNRTNNSIIFFLLFITSFISCTNSSDESKKIMVYEDINEYDESRKAYFFQDIVIIKKQRKEEYEYAVFNLDKKDITGVNDYPNANQVYEIQMELLDKKSNLIKSTFGNIGERYKNILVFKNHSIEFGNLPYEKIVPSEKDLNFAKQIINNIGVKFKESDIIGNWELLNFEMKKNEYSSEIFKDSLNYLIYTTFIDEINFNSKKKKVNIEFYHNGTYTETSPGDVDINGSYNLSHKTLIMKEMDQEFNYDIIEKSNSNLILKTYINPLNIPDTDIKVHQEMNMTLIKK